MMMMMSSISYRLGFVSASCAPLVEPVDGACPPPRTGSHSVVPEETKPHVLICTRMYICIYVYIRSKINANLGKSEGEKGTAEFYVREGTIMSFCGRRQFYQFQFTNRKLKQLNETIHKKTIVQI